MRPWYLTYNSRKGSAPGQGRLPRLLFESGGRYNTCTLQYVMCNWIVTCIPGCDRTEGMAWAAVDHDHFNQLELKPTARYRYLDQVFTNCDE